MAFLFFIIFSDFKNQLKFQRPKFDFYQLKNNFLKIQ